MRYKSNIMKTQEEFDEIVQRLLTPVKPGDEWKINLSEVLCRYQEYISCSTFSESGDDDNSSGFQPRANFIEAGLIIENVSNIYSLRVDNAYDSILNCNESLRKTLLDVSSNTENATVSSHRQDISRNRQKSIRNKRSSKNVFSEDISELNQELKIQVDRNKRKITGNESLYNCPPSTPIFLQRKQASNIDDVANEPITLNNNIVGSYKYDYLIYSKLVNKYTETMCEEEIDVILKVLSSNSRNSLCTQASAGTMADSGIVMTQGSLNPSQNNLLVSNITSQTETNSLHPSNISNIANNLMPNVAEILSQTTPMITTPATPLSDCSVVLSRFTVEQTQTLMNSSLEYNMENNNNPLENTVDKSRIPKRRVKVTSGFLGLPIRLLKRKHFFDIPKEMKRLKKSLTKVANCANSLVNVPNIKLTKRPYGVGRLAGNISKVTEEANNSDSVIADINNQSMTDLHENIDSVLEDNIPENSSQQQDLNFSQITISSFNLLSNELQSTPFEKPNQFDEVNPSETENNNSTQITQDITDVAFTEDSGIPMSSSHLENPSVENTQNATSEDQTIFNRLHPHGTVNSQLTGSTNRPKIPDLLLPGQMNLMELYKIVDPDMDNRIRTWHEIMKDKQPVSGNYSNFHLKDYEKMVLDKVQSADEQQCTFLDILNRNRYEDAGRYLLSALQMANDGKVLVSQDSSGDLLNPSSVHIALRERCNMESANEKSSHNQPSTSTAIREYLE